VNHQRLLARALCQAFPHALVLLIGEVRAGITPLFPPGLQCLALPSLPASSGKGIIPARELVDLRRKLILSTVQSFNPDVLLIQREVLGLQGELDQTLNWCMTQNKIHRVLLLEDALPQNGQREKIEAAIRSYYERVWILGDASVLNHTREYNVSLDLVQKIRYAGYPDHRMRFEWFEQEGTHVMDALGLAPGHLILCLPGDGEEGEQLAETFSHIHMPPKTNGIIACGPALSASLKQKLQRRLAGYPRIRLVEVNRDYAWLLEASERVVCAGNHENVSEVLAFEKPGLIIPRRTKLQEDLMRSKHLGAMNLVEALHPDLLSPEAISKWLSREVPASTMARRKIQLSGLQQVPSFLKDLLKSASV
jgi:predicted glycosyltransferase